MRAATISVAMATHNGERFLREQLASVARQSRLPDELVITDDDSTDATLSIVEEFAQSAPFPVRMHKNPVCLGWRDNFFAAMSQCRCDLIALCDQDDVWHDDKLARCGAWFDRRPDLALLVHSGRVVSEDLRPTRRRWPPIRRTRVLSPDSVPFGFGYHGMALVFPRWLLDAVKPAERPASLAREEPVFMNHDLWICFVAPTAGSIVLLADELLLYRRHDTVVSSIDEQLGGSTGWRGLFDVPAKEPSYEIEARRRRETADFLEDLAKRHAVVGSRRVDFRVHRQHRYQRRAAMAFEGRVEVIRRSSSRRRRLVRLASLILQGGYGRRGRGGLGITRIPLDLAVAMATPRRLTPSAG